LFKLGQDVFNSTFTYADLRSQLGNGGIRAFQEATHDLCLICTQPYTHSYTHLAVRVFPQYEWRGRRLMVIGPERLQRNDRFKHISFDELGYSARCILRRIPEPN